jgi:CHAT domain-containing protein
MIKSGTTLFFLIIIIICFSQQLSNTDTAHDSLKTVLKNAEDQFHQAEKLADKAGDNEKLLSKTDSLYKLSHYSYDRVIGFAQSSKNDSLLFFACIKNGYIDQYIGNNSSSKSYYLLAEKAKNNLPQLADSLLFAPYIFLGGIYQTEFVVDSALYYYKKAEQIAALYPVVLQEAQRLYNRMGILQYETGNYTQASNYFKKAIDITPVSQKGFISNYKINIAHILVRMEDYEGAKKAFEELLPDEEYRNEINNGLAVLNIKTHDYKKAVSCLSRINYEESPRKIDLYYNYAEAMNGLLQQDSANYYIQKALAENIKWNGSKKTSIHGLLLSLQADQLLNQKQYNQEIDLLQQAIIQFHSSFNETEIYKNPDQFTSAFSYIHLFNALIKKAKAFRQLYIEDKDEKNLTASLDAYQSAFKLSAYVEKTYNSDEARLFLNNIKYSAHNEPIMLCIELYDLTGKKIYLEHAYQFDQQNKASILSLSIHESDIKNQSDETNTLLQQISSIKTNITRLSLKANTVTDSAGLAHISTSIRDYEIELDKLQEKIKSTPEWQQANIGGQIPSIKSLQKKLDNKSAVISYHLSDNEMLALIITRNKLDYYKAPIDSNFFLNIEAFKQALHQTAGGQRYDGINASRQLFSALIKPLQPGLTQTERLVIIPDDELHYLPFEALHDDNDSYLMQKYSVQYLYSTALFQSEKNYSRSSGILSFAPFASNGYIDSNGSSFCKLSASGDEIKDLQGKSLIDTAATKENFIEQANHLPVIHLATHASVNNEDANRSFIAFYPSNNDYKLYAGEIYNMRLDSTELVILSACETGTGKLIKGEGLMSLSRAFAYAGCKNIITSLWKAEDATTSFITKQLHTYLSKGFTKDKALRQAKLDLLKSTDINPQLKTPNYWAHLVFVGNYEEGPSSSNWIWVAFAIIFFAFVYLLMLRKKPRRNDRA